MGVFDLFWMLQEAAFQETQKPHKRASMILKNFAHLCTSVMGIGK